MGSERPHAGTDRSREPGLAARNPLIEGLLLAVPAGLLGGWLLAALEEAAGFEHVGQLIRT